LALLRQGIRGPGADGAHAQRGTMPNLIEGTLVKAEGLGPEYEGKIAQVASYDEAADSYRIIFIDGTFQVVKAANVKMVDDLKRPGVGGDPNSFDLLVGPKVDQATLAEEIALCLLEKGFCVLRLPQNQGDLDAAAAHLRKMGDDGKLRRLAEEVEEGYLGAGARGKVAWMNPGAEDSPDDDMLKRSDQFISTLASLVQPHCMDLFGKVMDMRTPALVSLSLEDGEEAEYPSDDADDAVLGDYYRTWRASLLKVVHFMGPAVADVTLESSGAQEAGALPHKNDLVEIACEPNTVLIFRTGAFSYGCQSRGEVLTLTASLLENPGTLYLADWEGDTNVIFDCPGPKGLPGEQVNIVNMATRLMANWDVVEGYNAGLVACTDGATEIPLSRWNVHLYYNPDDDDRQPWQTYLKHQSLVEGLELFDNKYFEITASDARIMDPLQRHVLEVGAQCLFKMGITKKHSNRNPHHGGCSVGLDKDDWDKQFASDMGCGGGTNQQAIISNRFSFIFNLRGPNYVADTACSASLCATHLAKYTLQDRSIDKIEFHIALGIHNVLLPWGFGQGGMGHMISGRCKTFDEAANGYMRGDGCSGVTLKFGLLEDERDAVWRASKCGQNGRSATMTAPNGIAQEELINKTLREGKMSAVESCIWCCHGTGTSLGDPIEVGGVRRVQVKEKRSTTLLMVTNKTHTGHLEGGAAMTTIIAATLQVKNACCIGICHFRQLNPNLEQTQFDMCINSELNNTLNTQNNIHISSFGFGGTNGHAILWGLSHIDVQDVPTMVKRRLQKMAAPEMRVNGSDPSEWEWDGPDMDAKPGAKWKVTFTSDQALDAAVQWVKEQDGAEPEDTDEDDFYCITGPFIDWDSERMEDGDVTGLRTYTAEVPNSGSLIFQFLKNGDDTEKLYPPVDQCGRKTAPVLGPSDAKDDPEKEKNTWYVAGVPGSFVKIDLFICRGLRSVNWTPV